MRVLILDHFFEQDIEALVNAAGDGDEMIVVPYTEFFGIARRVFPDPVFTGLEAYLLPEYDEHRRNYAHRARRRLHELWMLYRFDAVLAPSDTFFWIRPVITASQELEIPFIVLQKEATIPPGWLEGPAREWGAILPFVADLMLVSSDHHRQFWLNAGTDSDLVRVTGQPRFDIYRQPERWSTWKELGVEVPEGMPTVLFLTYDLSAYLPVIVRDGLAPWAQLRGETEEVLLSLSAAGDCFVLVKPHPQPAEDQSTHLAELGRARNVEILDPRGDTRQFIARSDVVVGFQTTALFEALAAGRPTIYTHWTPPAEELADTLVPFHEERSGIDVARSPLDLRRLLREALAGAPEETERTQRRHALFTEYLGALDGKAARRCLAETATLVESKRAERSTHVSLEFERLVRRRAPWLRRQLPRVAVEGVAWPVAARIAPWLHPFYDAVRRARRRPSMSSGRLQQVLSARSRLARQRLAAAVRGSR